MSGVVKMEAAPRLPMLWFPLKFSPEGTSFNSLKKYIAECYQENPDSFSKEVYALETLRNAAMHPTKDVAGCATLKRYYCQLHSLANRFPQVLERNLFTFTWKDLYVNNAYEISDFRYEMAAVLFNIAGHHTQLGASVNRSDPDGMKLACTHFQIAAWSYGELREKYQGINSNNDFMTPELLLFMQQVSFAQAQECILEKSLIDNRKPAIVAKVTAQIVSYYGAALAAMLSGGDDGTIGDIVGSSVFKDWKKYVRFKTAYLNSILFLYQGQQAEEQQKMGERVTLFQAASDNLEEARKESKGLSDQKEIIEALTFTTDVVEGKRKAAKNENEYIYHEAVPELKDISAVQGANLVNGINFSVTDPDVAGEDIFARLIPMKAHEASSMYSEEKAQLLRQVGGKVTEKDNELNTFMSSLNVDNLNVSEERANKIPQGIVDRCAAINAKPNAIPDLITSMSSLAEICADVETSLKEIKELLNKEDINERKYQQESGVHRTNAHFTELSREFQKYMEAHQKAGDSNDTLRRAMELHVNNLRILAKPLQEIQQSVPKLSGEVNENVFHDLKLILNKVNEMKAQRAQFCADLRIAINDDDITSKIIAHGEENDVKELFKKEIGKHDKLVALIDQNLKAQDNILAALTEHYAQTAPVLKTINDVKHKRDNFFSSLAASYDVYEDLLAKSAKGLEFYKKLQGNVQKLLARVKAACDVQNEDRQQRMNSMRPKASTNVGLGITPPASKSTAPKLKDYLKSGKLPTSDATYIPPIRPSPLGSEATPSSACATSTPTYYTAQSQMPHIPNDYPPPPYTPPTQQYYDTNGYTNPIYQNNQIPAAGVKYDYNYSGYDQQMQYQNQMQAYQNPQTSATSSISSHSITQANTAMAQPTNQHYQYPPAVTPEQPANMSYQANANYSYGTHATDAQTSYPNQTPNYMQPYQQPTSQNQQPQQYHYPQQVQQPQLTPAPSPSPSFSSITPQINQTPTQSTWTPTSMTTAFENLSIQNSAPAVTNFPSTWNTNVAQPAAVPVDTVSQQQNAVQLPGTVVPSTNTWNSAVPSTAAPVQETQQPNSATISYPTYPATNQGQTNESQNVGVYPQQPQQQPIEYVQSHAAAHQIPYVSQPAVYSYTQAETAQYNGTGYQDAVVPPSAYPSYTTATATNTVDSISTTPAMGATVTNQYSATTNDTIPSQTYPQQMQSTDNLNQGVTSGYYNAANAYQAAGVPYSQPTPDPMISANLQQNYNNSNLPNATSYSHSTVNASAPQATPQAAPAASNQQQPATKKSAPKSKTTKKSSNIDLLSEIDFSANLPTPPLQPQVASSKKAESPTPSGQEPLKSTPLQPEPVAPSLTQPKPPEQPPSKVEPPPTPTIPSSIDRKQSCDNISICSDLSSLADHSFDWDSVSLRSEAIQSNVPSSANQQIGTEGSGAATTSTTIRNPFDDPKILKYFHKEVERYEKMIESLNVKMLNGNTPLVNKWKDLQDLLVRDEAKRTTAIARLFPEKNRSTDCIPFDHARVVLQRSTDDYINAAYVKDLGPGCPTFIMAQTPLQNTVNDFWSMIWTQKARTVVCLHTPNEILDTFWPKELNKEMNFDDFSVTLVKQFDLSHCTELNLKLTMNGADAILDLSLIQIKAWTKSSPAQILGIAQNILVAYKQRSQEFNSHAPLIMNCLTGSERSGLIALAICAILATQTKRPILINVVDVWYRICSQRKSALRDTNNLELSMQVVLSHGHDLLNKRGIMTSYQMKNIQKTAAVEKEEIKDPFSDLDPLWKLKQKT